MKYSVCLDALYPGVDLAQALPDIREAGIDTVEFWNWSNRDLAALEKAVTENRMEVRCFCTEGGTLSLPQSHDEYLSGLEHSAQIAHRLHCRRLITQTGPETGDHAQTLRNIEEGLKKCDEILEREDLILLVEPLNTRIDHPGYSLVYSEEAAELLERVGNPRIQLLFDLYHQQISEGDLLRHVQDCLPWIGHFHSAGSQSRGYLEDGEIAYPYVFRKIKEMGYEGCIGLEYFPKGERGFNRLPKLE